MAVQLEESWNEVLRDEFEKEYMINLKAFLAQEKKEGKIIYPPDNCVFNAFAHTPFNNVKAVIIGQDPYHGPSQAHGLAFSVQKGVSIPPSLRNIFKELANDISGFKIPVNGELTKWADEGVLLLNAALTVRAGEAGSHQKKGWEKFTDQAIKVLSEKREGIVFLLWGNYAQSKGAFIDDKKHFILKATHPSPLAHGFIGCKHFSKTNEILEKEGKKGIDWKLS
ncbi:uracil-DNA glycosylase [Pedobacter sp. P351]|uniref:uracil-DNA glycosylase n=1 Tax=Pedobacter superstes TaxID=3133441 RepID=UPI0030986F58